MYDILVGCVMQFQRIQLQTISTTRIIPSFRRARSLLVSWAFALINEKKCAVVVKNLVVWVGSRVS